MRVVGIRGAFVGYVGGVNESSFEVEPDEGSPYWLAFEAVYAVSNQRVELICDAGEVGRYVVTVAEG